MSYESEIKRSILETAIIFFGERGFSGVTTRALAKEARTSEGSIFKHFKSKELLFRRALTRVIDSMEHAMGKMLVEIYTDHKNQDARQFAMESLTRWYLALSAPAARLLQQGLMADSTLHEGAYRPISRIVEILAAGLAALIPGKPYPDLQESVDTLVTALFQYKVTQHSADQDAELETAKTNIGNWLDDVLKD